MLDDDHNFMLQLARLTNMDAKTLVSKVFLCINRNNWESKFFDKSYGMLIAKIMQGHYSQFAFALHQSMLITFTTFLCVPT